ncbi:MAG: AtpZ/AtpI family protein [Lachnospiraceae bacterium]|nr:AtpZ/AtpI family protein [Lachnospiraceae bacterium]
MKMLALITQLAISMLTAIFISGVIGYFIDYFFGTNLFIFFLILGVAGGYKTCYNVICKFLGRKSLFESTYRKDDKK